jgi:hypothetical protein
VANSVTEPYPEVPPGHAVLVLGVNYTVVPVLGAKGIRYSSYDWDAILNWKRVEGTEDYVYSREVVDSKVVPLHRVVHVDRERDKEETFLFAYTEEVQKFLGIPYNVLHEHVQELERQRKDAVEQNRKILQRIRAAGKSLRSRLKFLFTGRLEVYGG